MNVNLIETLSRVPDPRAKRGRRYPLWFLLLLVIMGTISECLGYTALEDFARRHYKGVSEHLQLPGLGFPSDSTFRRVMMRIDFDQLAKVFNHWAMHYVPIEESPWLAIDGKSIKATVTNYDQFYQNFVNVVSVFSVRQGLSIHLNQFQNKYNSEIAVVQAIVEALDLKGVLLTLDSLHCQKKQSN